MAFFEIIDETDSLMEMRCLLNAGDMPIRASLNRMYLLVTSLMRDIVGCFDGGELEFLSDTEERESEVDALLYLVERTNPNITRFSCCCLETEYQ